MVVAPPSVAVIGCKRPLVVNVANPSQETTPLLRPYCRLFDLRGSCPNQDQHWYRKGDHHGSGLPENVRTANTKKGKFLELIVGIWPVC